MNLARFRVFYNSRENEHAEIKRRLDPTNIPYSMLPTSGPYTLHLIDETGNSGLALGPTSVIQTLDLILTS